MGRPEMRRTLHGFSLFGGTVAVDVPRVIAVAIVPVLQWEKRREVVDLFELVGLSS